MTDTITICREAEDAYDTACEDICKQWEDDPKAFEEWFKRERRLTSSRKITRIDEGKPYSPENCLLFDCPFAVGRDMKRRYGKNYVEIWQTKVRYNGETVFAGEWSTLKGYVRWLTHHLDQVPFGGRMKRLDKDLPFSPSNCVFVQRAEKTEDPEREEEKELKKLIRKIKEEYGISFDSRYLSLAIRGQIDRDLWPRIEFYRYIRKLYEEGKIYAGMHLHKIDRNKPLSADNVYTSYRMDGRTTHGLSFTRLLIHYEKFIADGGMSVEELLKAVDPKRVLAGPNGETSWIEDIRRIVGVYRSEVKGRDDGFGSADAFVKWSVYSGYTPYKDFRRVKDGAYSPDTCVWDIFTADGKDEHTRLIYSMAENAKHRDYYYKKRANLKANGGVCQEWADDLEAFEAYILEHDIKPGDTMIREDKTKPFGPDNIAYIRRAAPEPPDEFTKGWAKKYSNWKSSGKLCDEWLDFNVFLDHMKANGLDPEDRYEHIDRKKPFGPGNIRKYGSDAAHRTPDMMRLRALQARMRRSAGLIPEWEDLDTLAEYIIGKDALYDTRIIAPDRSKPFGPDNIRIYRQRPRPRSSDKEDAWL